MDLFFLKPLVEDVLRHHESREWSVQGFGFLRTYFGPASAPKKFRLNLWDDRFTVPNVSTIHDHPWDFDSVVIAGEFINQRYDLGYVGEYPRNFSYTTIKTGAGGGLERAATEVCALRPKPEELYKPGDMYYQRADEIHETKFANGSVTLNQRIGDTEHARVFWPYGTDWVDAIPREALNSEVEAAVSYSLGKWF